MTKKIKGLPKKSFRHYCHKEKDNLLVQGIFLMQKEYFLKKTFKSESDIGRRKFGLLGKVFFQKKPKLHSTPSEDRFEQNWYLLKKVLFNNNFRTKTQKCSHFSRKF